MKSIILNLRQDADNYPAKNDLDTTYANLVNSKATITVMPRDPVTNDLITVTNLTDYPISNLTNSYSTTKEVRTRNTMSYPKTNGISISPVASYLTQATFNTIYININKLNKTYIKNFQKNQLPIGGNFYYMVSLRSRSAPTAGRVCSMLFKDNNTVVVRASTTSEYEYNYKTNLQEGNILITEELLKAALVSLPLNTEDYIFDFCIRHYGDDAYNLDFSVSNIFIGNSIDFFVNEGFKFQNNNLTVFENSKRVGKTFIQKNESIKSCKIDLDLLTVKQSNGFYNNLFKSAKDTPIVFFPFVEDDLLQDNNEDKFDFSMQNMEVGGLYYISKDFEFDNQYFNVYNISLDLIEYK